MKTFRKILFAFFILYSCASSIFYFWGLLARDQMYNDLRFRSKVLYLVSPLPLLFDRQDFFNSSSLAFKFLDGTSEVFEIDKSFMATFPGSSHRQLHFLRLFAFANFYNSPEWVAAMQFTACRPENIGLHLNQGNQVIQEIQIKNIYSEQGIPKESLVSVPCRN